MNRNFYVMITIWVAVSVAAASPLSDAKELSLEDLLDQEAYLLQNKDSHGQTSNNKVAAQSCSGWEWLKCGGEVAKCASDCAQGITSSQCISCLGSSYDECKNCFSRMELAHAQSCSGWEWVTCGGEVAKCAADCAQGITSSQCISCLGSSYHQCKNCFSQMEEVLVQNHASDQIANAQSCSGWEWLKCGGEVAKCTADCAQGITSSQCISCLGSSYDECKNCFSRMEEVIVQNDASNQVANAQSCSGWEWLKCGGEVVKCTADCAQGITSSICISCLGSSYYECKNCFSLIMMEQVHIQKATHCSGKPIFGFFRHKHNCFNKNGKCCATESDGTGTVSKADKSQDFCGYCFTGRPGLLFEEMASQNEYE